MATSTLCSSHRQHHLQVSGGASVGELDLSMRTELYFDFRIYHRSVRETEYTVNETILTSLSLEPLKPNSQYIVYVTASTEKGESLPSETLIAWTDPAHSPYVEVSPILSKTRRLDTNFLIYNDCFIH